MVKGRNKTILSFSLVICWGSTVVFCVIS